MLRRGLFYKASMILLIGTDYYNLRYIDRGFLYAEDRGLWRSHKVKKNSAGDWFCCDDDDYMIDIEKRKVMAREIGWDLRREKI